MGAGAEGGRRRGGEADPPGREGARGGRRFGTEHARRPGGGDRRRDGGAAGRAVRAEDPRRHDAPPVRRLGPAGGARGDARRPRRRDRGVAAGEALGQIGTLACVSEVSGVVLAGGRSTRMGRPKANLEWHGSTLLHRVTGIVARAIDGPVVVVRAPDQELPELPPGVRVVEDAAEGRGPLQGLAAGLSAVAGDSELAYVSSTDVPLLHPAFVRAVARAASGADVDVALPVVHGFRHPLAAAYRTALVG